MKYKFLKLLNSDLFRVFFLAFILVFISFLIQGNILINLADEGYLWYGTICTSNGNIPIRDFQSYDPGRYYWTYIFTKILGKGIMTLRLSVCIFQFSGLIFGLLALKRINNSWWFLSVSGILLLVWMYPRHKIFSHSIIMMTVYFGVLLIEKPSYTRYFITGIFIGLSAFFGRNHGLYNFISFLLLISFIWLKIDRTNLIKKLLYWISGIILGYTPMLYMFIAIPDFFNTYINLLMLHLHIGSTNLPLPVPWAWKVNYISMDRNFLLQFFTGTFFLLLPVYYTMSVIYLLTVKKNFQQKAIFISTAFIGIIYIHYAFSRADLGHLAHSIHPFLMGLMSLPFLLKNKYLKLISILLLAAVYIMSYYSIWMVSPYYIKASAPKDSFVKINICSDNVWLDKPTADVIETVKKIKKDFIASEEVFIAPHWPGFYPILQKKSPLGKIYFIFKETKEVQEKMISDLENKHINWVILGDVPLDGRDDLRFKNTYCLVWKYIMDNFQPVKVEGLPENYQLLHRKL
jgi:hypothetical protein